MFARSDMLDPGRPVRDLPSKLGAAFTFVSLFMGIGFAVQQSEELNEKTGRSLRTYTRGLFETLSKSDGERESSSLDFGTLHLSVEFAGSFDKDAMSCTANELGVQPVKSLGCKVEAVVQDDIFATCKISWLCHVPLNITGTIDVQVPSVPIQWQAARWKVDATSRQIRDGAGYNGKRHITSLQGVHAPADGQMLCGESKIELTLTR